MAAHSPGSRIPSHGTDQLAQRYAYDLWRVDGRKAGYHEAGTLRMILLGVHTTECYGWGEPVHAPFDGVVVRAIDGMKERGWLHPARELFHVLRNAVTFRPSRLNAVLGNHVIARSGETYALFAHLAPGTICVEEGKTLSVGDVLGGVGSTGNSTAPHLHFQLMDGPDMLEAKAVPCAFTTYEVLKEAHWQRVERGIPLTTDRIRSIGAIGPHGHRGDGSTILMRLK
jgi:hypothetical protein